MAEKENKKTGDLLKQLAIISDLIEKLIIKTNENNLILSLDDDEFKKTITYFVNKDNNIKIDKIKNQFVINIGEVNITFLNKNNV
jgi:hypothetical protein